MAFLSLVTAALVLAAGCGGVGSSNRGPGVPGPPASADKFVYALNGSAGPNAAIAGFRIDPASGVLTTLSGSPFGLGLPGAFSVSTMAATPVTGFLHHSRARPSQLAAEARRWWW